MTAAREASVESGEAITKNGAGSPERSPSGILGNVSAGNSAAADGGETGAVFIPAIVTTGGFESPDENLWV